MSTEEDDTIIPMKDVTAKLAGIVMSCDQIASLGFAAKREKSGSFMMRAAKLAMDDMMPRTTCHASSDPWIVLGWLTMGPGPPARTTVQTRKAMPATGTT